MINPLVVEGRGSFNIEERVLVVLLSRLVLTLPILSIVLLLLELTVLVDRLSRAYCGNGTDTQGSLFLSSTSADINLSMAEAISFDILLVLLLLLAPLVLLLLLLRLPPSRIILFNSSYIVSLDCINFQSLSNKGSLPNPCSAVNATRKASSYAPADIQARITLVYIDVDTRGRRRVVSRDLEVDDDDVEDDDADDDVEDVDDAEDVEDVEDGLRLVGIVNSLLVEVVGASVVPDL